MPRPRGRASSIALWIRRSPHCSPLGKIQVSGTRNDRRWVVRALHEAVGANQQRYGARPDGEGVSNVGAKRKCPRFGGPIVGDGWAGLHRPAAFEGIAQLGLDRGEVDLRPMSTASKRHQMGCENPVQPWTVRVDHGAGRPRRPLARSELLVACRRHWTMGPNPDTQRPVRVRVKNTDVCMSSKPVVASGLGSDVIASSGSTMTFHAGVKANGNSGSMFTLSPVFPRGPTRNPVTDSIGNLIDAAKGFSASFARSCAVMVGRDGGGGSATSCARTTLAGHRARRRPAGSMTR
jgi:hypothetical protein